VGRNGCFLPNQALDLTRCLEVQRSQLDQINQCNLVICCYEIFVPRHGFVAQGSEGDHHRLLEARLILGAPHQSVWNFQWVNKWDLKL